METSLTVWDVESYLQCQIPISHLDRFYRVVFGLFYLFFHMENPLVLASMKEAVHSHWCEMPPLTDSVFTVCSSGFSVLNHFTPGLVRIIRRLTLLSEYIMHGRPHHLIR